MEKEVKQRQEEVKQKQEETKQKQEELENMKKGLLPTQKVFVLEFVVVNTPDTSCCDCFCCVCMSNI